MNTYDKHKEDIRNISKELSKSMSESYTKELNTLSDEYIDKLHAISKAEKEGAND